MELESELAGVKRTQFVILALIAINLALTGYLIVASRAGGGIQSGGSALPASLSKSETDRIMNSFQDLWNAEDMAGLHQLFHPKIQLQVTTEQVGRVVDMIKPRAGNIVGNAFDSYTHQGSSGNFGSYTIVYVVKFVNGQSGRVNFQIVANDSEFEIHGFNVGLD